MYQLLPAAAQTWSRPALTAGDGSPFSPHGGSSIVGRAVKGRRRGRARSAASAPIELDEAYLLAVKKLESLPQNQSGADKSWVERAIQSWRDHYARASR